MSRTKCMCAVALVVVCAANTASAVTIEYDARIVVEWFNGLAGQHVDVDESATVTIDYTSPTSFEIIDIDFAVSSGGLLGGLHALQEDPALASTGTITPGSPAQASGNINYVGTADLSGAGGPPVAPLINSGGSYGGSMTGSSGAQPIFTTGDRYVLQAPSFGTVFHGLPLSDNYDHVDAPGVENTYIEFLTPEPTAAMLLTIGAATLLRRRRD